jgi:hypothetical protein
MPADAVSYKTNLNASFSERVNRYSRLKSARKCRPQLIFGSFLPTGVGTVLASRMILHIPTFSRLWARPALWSWLAVYCFQSKSRRYSKYWHYRHSALEYTILYQYGGVLYVDQILRIV